MPVQRDPLTDVDELMQRIREEVAKRRGLAVAPVPSRLPARHHQASLSPLTIRFPSIPSFAVEPDFELKPSGYDIADFTRFHHADFVKAAFKGILGRDPDPDGLSHFLLRLALGDSKALVLGLIRFSPEGRSRGVRIRGLTPRYAVERAGGIPSVGYLLRLMIALVRLPRILRHVRQLENFTTAELASLKEHTSSVDHTLHGALETWISLHRKDRDAIAREVIGVIADVSAWKADVSAWKADVSAWKVSADLRLVKALKVQAALADVRAEQAASALEMKRIEQEIMKRLGAQKDVHALDQFYADFEETFRGERQDIKERVGVHLQTLLEAPIGTADMSVVDIGCGRGEWLQLLKEHNFHACGVDVNRVTLASCRALGLDVVEEDGIEYLRRLPAESVGAVTAFHVVEHLPFSEVVALFTETARVLRTGGIAIFETPNPENVLVGSNTFYLDPTHRNPIPPSTLGFVARAMGLSDTRIAFLHPYPEWERLSTGDEGIGKFVNSRFFGPRDYALICRK